MTEGQAKQKIWFVFCFARFARLMSFHAWIFETVATISGVLIFLKGLARKAGKMFQASRMRTLFTECSLIFTLHRSRLSGDVTMGGFQLEKMFGRPWNL